MKKRVLYGFAILLLVLSTVLVVWQGSFHQRDFMPQPAQTLILWAVSTLIFILMITVGWILAREFIKLYVARRANRPGSRIRTKLVIGAMALSCVPVFFLFLWMYEMLGLNLTAWFTNPVDQQLQVYVGAARSLDREIQHRLDAQAALLAGQPETIQLLASGAKSHDTLERFARQQALNAAAILSPSGQALDVYGAWPIIAEQGRIAVARYALPSGSVVVAARIPLDAARDLA